MHMLNKLSACILTGTLILSGMTSTVKADENMIYTDHHTYYIGNVEYNEDGTIVDASHVCNMQVEVPPTTDGNDTEVTPDPEPSEPTEPVTPAPTPVPQPPKEDGSTATFSLHYRVYCIYCLYCFYFHYLDIVLLEKHNCCPTASHFVCQLYSSKSTIRRNCKGDG